MLTACIPSLHTWFQFRYYTAMIKFLTSKPCTTLSFIWLYPYSKRGDGMGRRLHRWSKNTSFVEVGVGTWNDLQLYRQKGKGRKEETYPDQDPDQTPKNLQKEPLRVDPTEWVGGGYQLLLSPVKSSLTSPLHVPQRYGSPSRRRG